MTADHAFEIEVRFENRPDGGVRAYSPDLPLFVLSHQDKDTLMKNVVPVLECMLSHRLKGNAKVVKLMRFGESSEMLLHENVVRFASRIAA